MNQKTREFRFVKIRDERIPNWKFFVMIFVAIIGLAIAINSLYEDKEPMTVKPKGGYSSYYETPLAGASFEIYKIMQETKKNVDFEKMEDFQEEELIEEVVSVTYLNGPKEKKEPVKHFPESTYIKGAIMLTGEAGGVKSLTEQSGCLWVACNRVESPLWPDDLESVIEQPWQFNGYTPGGDYYEQCYDMAVDVFERWYREQHGESSEAVGRTLPKDYLFFTGDGKHNHFTKEQYGSSYVWGSQFISPYKN